MKLNVVPNSTLVASISISDVVLFSEEEKMNSLYASLSSLDEVV